MLCEVSVDSVINPFLTELSAHYDLMQTGI